MCISKSFLLTLFLITFSYATFDPCKFNFGTDWDYLNTRQSGNVAKEVDYVTIWLADPSFNAYWHGTMLDFCKNNNKTPVFYSYIIAKASALGDADVGGALATKGANFIRTNWSTVTQRYNDYASKTASKWGTSAPIIWLMEPDYYQYSAPTQQGGGLSYAELGKKMGELVAIVKQYLPNAQISMDISAWMEDQGSTSAWYAAMPMSSMNYINTSGGRSNGNSVKVVDANNMTWSGVFNVTKKGIIADAGYGTGGGSTGENTSWNDANNLKARIADGVIAITQKSPTDGWGNTIQSLRTALSGQTLKSCNGNPLKPKYTLTVTTSGTGNVTISPQATSYDSGTTVTLTAVPSGGQSFSGWGGALSGNNTTSTIVMTGNKTVTATFVAGSKPKYTLTVTTSGSGNVTVSPQASQYDSGTTVTITAAPSDGQTFTGWSGAVSGSNTTATLVMNGNKTVTASFSGTSKPKYTLSVTTSGSGSVTINPQSASYDSGSTVNLTAAPSSGATFNGWGGALSGTNAIASIVMNGNKTVTATFTGGNTGVNLVSNGDFANGTTGWNLGVYGGAATNSVQNGVHVVNATSAGSAAWNIQLTQTGIKLEQGKSYVFSFTAKAASPTSIVANIGNATTYSSYLGEKTVNLTTENQTYTYTFTMTSATDNNVRLEFNSGLTSVTWYLDNVSISEGTAVIKNAGRSFQEYQFTKDLIPKDFFKTGHVSVSLYDHTGRLIQKMSNVNEGAAIDLQKRSGSFVAVITNGSKRLVKKIITVR
jgi:ribosomal protein L21E